MPGRNNPNQPNDQQQNKVQDQPINPLFPSDDDILAEGNLIIDDVAGSIKQQGGSGIDESRREVKFQPAAQSLDNIISTAVLAVDEKGNQYTDQEKIKAELSKNGRRLFVFEEDGEPPYAYENRKGQIFCSDQGISSHNQLPGHFFIPAGSLDPDRITGRPSKKKITSLNEEIKDAKREYEDKSEEIRKQRKEIKAQLAELEKKAPKLGVKKPTKPTFSWGRRIQRWAFKFITIGFGETDAYRKYQEEQARYNEQNEKYKTAWNKYKTENDAYLKEKEPLDKQLEALNVEIETLHAPLDIAEKKKEQIVGAHIQNRKDGAKKVREYRENLEVCLEGTADLLKEKKITRNNIFANTWLKKNACDGKDPSDPEARQALEEYLASKMVEDKLLSQTMADDLDSRTKEENEGLLRSLNNGKAVKDLQKSEEYKAVIDDAEELGELIDPEGLYQDLKKRINLKISEERSPAGKLEKLKKQMIDDFGKKPISEASVQDIINLNKLNDGIRMAKTNPKFDIRAANMIVTELYQHPDKQKMIFTNNLSDADTKKTVQSLAGQQEGKLYSLDEMTKLVNDTHQAQKNAAAQNPQLGS